MFASSSHQEESYKNLQVGLPPSLPRQPPPPPPPPHLHQMPIESSHVRQLLTAAQLISRSDFSTAHRLISFLSSHSSAYGDSSDRIIHSFTKALALRLKINRSINSNQDLRSSYLTLNQITPYIRFLHFTANQAILESMHQSHQHIHIIDFDIMHGVQWPPLMQAIAGQFPPPTLRITATGANLSILHRTGDHLSKFAHSLGLRFHFNPLLLNTNTETLNVDHLVDCLSKVQLSPNETLAVNCVLYLHRRLKNRRNLCLLLSKIKSMNPAVVTLSEQEANHNHPIFLSRFTEALNYYTSVFKSLEATLPPTSRERMEVEQVWFGREIADIVAEEGDSRKERHERYRSWEVMMMSAGFLKVPLSGYALSQAKLLLRLHYPCEGYDLQVVDDCFFLGWRNQPLYSVSSWR